MHLRSKVYCQRYFALAIDRIDAFACVAHVSANRQEIKWLNSILRKYCLIMHMLGSANAGFIPTEVILCLLGMQRFAYIQCMQSLNKNAFQ